MRILLKFPTRARPVRFMATLKRWLDYRSGKQDVAVLVAVDRDDATMNTPEMLTRLVDLGIDVVASDAATKVEAINCGLEGREFDVLVLASDDMVPQVQGYDDVIATDMAYAFPNLDGALHYPDGFRSDLITLSIMGRNLYRRFGYIYHPAYKSLWPDTEFTEVVKTLGKYWYSPQVLVRHEHPLYTGLPPDALQRRNDSYFKEDRDTYVRRKAHGYDLSQPVLSILIATLVEREASRGALLAELNRQVFDLADPWQVELRLLLDAGEVPIGEKRNALMQAARGRYVCFVDDDDMVAPTYVKDILGAIASNPAADCVVFRGRVTYDGRMPTEFSFSVGHRDGARNQYGAILRIPNHLCPIRRELATTRPFPAVRLGEDSSWSHSLAGVVKTEAAIDRVLYFYQFSKTGTRTQTAANWREWRQRAGKTTAPAPRAVQPRPVVAVAARAKRWALRR